MNTQKQPQISFPAGLVSHMEAWVDGIPDVNLPQCAARQRMPVMLFPADMVSQGYIYIRADFIRSLRVGDPIQIDRTHTRIEGIGEPEVVEDIGPTPRERVLACRVRLARERTYV